jgi:CheY-like chemotaxis protein
VRLPRLVSSEVRSPTRAAAERPANGRRVLVVDDSRDGAEMLQLLLEQHGCDVRVVNDGPGAIAVAASFCPDLVFLDIGMPAMDGYETCRRIRETAAGSSMSIVALTGWGQDRDRERSTLAGFDRHLVKPVDTGELLQVVRECPVGRRATADR